VSDPPDTVLIVDDDVTYRDRLVRSFERRGLVAVGVGDAKAAVYVARRLAPRFAVVDLRIPGKSGLELVPELVGIVAGINVVVVTGYGSIATALAAVHRGARHYLTKPVDADDILLAFAGGLGAVPPASEGADLVPSLARVEWEHLQRVLTDCGGNISEAARRLRMQRRSLQRKLAKYPVPR
jgi:two-component system response regulator RegA